MRNLETKASLLSLNTTILDGIVAHLTASRDILALKMTCRLLYQRVRFPISTIPKRFLLACRVPYPNMVADMLYRELRLRGQWTAFERQSILTGLMEAVSWGHLVVIELILKVLDPIPEDVITQALYYASYYGQLHVLKRLLALLPRDILERLSIQHGAESKQRIWRPTVTRPSDNLPASCQSPPFSSVPTFDAPNDDADLRMSDRLFACFLAAVNQGHKCIVDYFLQLPILDPAMHNGLAVHHAAMRQHHAIVERLLRVPSVMAVVDWNLCLAAAAMTGNLALVERLLERPSVDVTAYGNLPLHLAQRARHAPIVERFMREPAVRVQALSFSSQYI